MTRRRTRIDTEAFQHYLDLIEEEDAFFRLLEAGDEILPWLEDRFAVESDPNRRRVITKVIWQHRNPESVPFLSRALADSSDLVWKEAIDGLVAIGGERIIAAMRSALKGADSNKQD